MSAAQAQIFTGPVPAAMGGAGRAGAESSQIMMLNPAAAVQADGLEMNLIFQDGYLARGTHESNYAISMVENREGLIAAGGFSYVKKRRTVGGQIAFEEQFIQGALAHKILPNRLSVGAAAFYSTQDLDGGQKYVQWNGSAGLLYTPTTRFGLAYVFANPVHPDQQIPMAARLIPQQSIGLHYMVPLLIRLTADVTRWEKQNPNKKGVLQMGSELMVAPFFLSRFGYEIDDITKQNRLTLGLGFSGPRLKMNYSFAKPMKDSNGAMHSVDMRVPF